MDPIRVAWISKCATMLHPTASPGPIAKCEGSDTIKHSVTRTPGDTKACMHIRYLDLCCFCGLKCLNASVQQWYKSTGKWLWVRSCQRSIHIQAWWLRVLSVQILLLSEHIDIAQLNFKGQYPLNCQYVQCSRIFWVNATEVPFQRRDKPLPCSRKWWSALLVPASAKAQKSHIWLFPRPNSRLAVLGVEAMAKAFRTCKMKNAQRVKACCAQASLKVWFRGKISRMSLSRSVGLNTVWSCSVTGLQRKHIFFTCHLKSSTRRTETTIQETLKWKCLLCQQNHLKLPSTLSLKGSMEKDGKGCNGSRHPVPTDNVIQCLDYSRFLDHTLTDFVRLVLEDFDGFLDPQLKLSFACLNQIVQ